MADAVRDTFGEFDALLEDLTSAITKEDLEAATKRDELKAGGVVGGGHLSVMLNDVLADIDSNRKPDSPPGTPPLDDPSFLTAVEADKRQSVAQYHDDLKSSKLHELREAQRVTEDAVLARHASELRAHDQQAPRDTGSEDRLFRESQARALADDITSTRKRIETVELAVEALRKQQSDAADRGDYDLAQVLQAHIDASDPLLDQLEAALDKLRGITPTPQRSVVEEPVAVPQPVATQLKPPTPPLSEDEDDNGGGGYQAPNMDDDDDFYGASLGPSSAKKEKKRRSRALRGKPGPNSALITAAKAGRITEIRRLVKQEHVHPDSFEPVTKNTALHVACMSGQTELCDGMIRLRANINARNSQGEVPIHKAATLGSSTMMKHLIENCRGNPFVEDYNGKTAWELCARHHSALGPFLAHLQIRSKLEEQAKELNNYGHKTHSKDHAHKKEVNVTLFVKGGKSFEFTIRGDTTGAGLIEKFASHLSLSKEVAAALAVLVENSKTALKKTVADTEMIGHIQEHWEDGSRFTIGPARGSSGQVQMHFRERIYG